MTVFIFGAGINRGIFDWDGLQPPLANDFFQLALKHSRTGLQRYRNLLQPLFEYIRRYWKLTIGDLEDQPFDLESCYTLIQLQRLEAQRRNDRHSWLTLARLEYRLTAFLAEYLSEFEYFIHNSEEFKALGNILYSEKPAVLTFNYDTLVESAIESASLVNADIPASYPGMPTKSGEVPDDELPYSHFNWNRPLSYGVQFDEVQLHRAGVPSIVSGERFYTHPENRLYNPPLLKLHGSINWFVHTGYTRLNDGLHDDKVGKTVLYRPTWWFNEPPFLGTWIIEPLIVTPVVNKETLRTPMIRKLWDRAREILATCRRLIVAGYSFPPTDFHTRCLFLEAFSENTPEEVVVINPEKGVVERVKELCHFRKPVVLCNDLTEFLTQYE